MKGETSEPEKQFQSDASENVEEPIRKSLGERGRRAMQGEPQRNPADGERPTDDGHEFERWANNQYFEGKGRRLNVNMYDNYQHLDRTSDSGIGLSKERRTDIYLDDTGEIWELKSGYETGGIDEDQLDNYQNMLDAGYVYERDDRTEKVKRPVNSVNYLFGTRAGAENNASKFADRDIFVYYVDETNTVQHLSH